MDLLAYINLNSLSELELKSFNVHIEDDNDDLN